MLWNFLPEAGLPKARSACGGSLAELGQAASGRQSSGIILSVTRNLDGSIAAAEIHSTILDDKCNHGKKLPELSCRRQPLRAGAGGSAYGGQSWKKMRRAELGAHLKRDFFKVDRALRARYSPVGPNF
jgi:hypothetical protein